MIQIIFSLLRVSCLIAFLSLTACHRDDVVELPIPKYSSAKELLKDTWQRPDLRVAYLKAHPQFWEENPLILLQLSEALYDIGHYQESRSLGFQLLLEDLSFFHRGKNYFTLAQNYQALGNIPKARYYLDKTLTRNNQYYYFYYARLEEFEEIYPKSIELYQKALADKQKDYILSAYLRTLHKALIFYKNNNSELYHSYLKIIKENPHFPQEKARIIEKSLKL